VSAGGGAFCVSNTPNARHFRTTSLNFGLARIPARHGSVRSFPIESVFPMLPPLTEQRQTDRQFSFVVEDSHLTRIQPHNGGDVVYRRKRRQRAAHRGWRSQQSCRTGGARGAGQSRAGLGARTSHPPRAARALASPKSMASESSTTSEAWMTASRSAGVRREQDERLTGAGKLTAQQPLCSVNVQNTKDTGLRHKQRRSSSEVTRVGAAIITKSSRRCKP
jgi:hypothetical protein